MATEPHNESDAQVSFSATGEHDLKLIAAMKVIKGTVVKKGSLWQHYKGAVYEVVGLYVEEATLTPSVCYRNIGTGVVWGRPLDAFEETVTVGDRQVRRFNQLVTESQGGR